MARESALTDLARQLYGLRPLPERDAPAAARAPRRGRRCHACASVLVHRDLPSGLLERLVLALTGRRPYRCVDCGHRFWDRPRTPRVAVRIRRGASPTPLQDQ